MNPPRLPEYYSELAPFRAHFETGLPILTYHKLGPRPRGTRLKGLYLGRRRFARQLAELRAAGFGPGSLDDWPEAASPNSRRVVLTFDDGFANVLEEGLDVLGRHGWSAIQFLVADRLGGSNDWETADGEARARLMTVEEVREWLAAGHRIGSHTLTHPWLTRLPPAAAREEIRASRERLEDRFGVPVRHFCYPYGDHNASVTEWVREAGYATACTVERGVNPRNASPWTLRRWTARYPSRGLKHWWRRWFGACVAPAAP